MKKMLIKFLSVLCLFFVVTGMAFVANTALVEATTTGGAFSSFAIDDGAYVYAPSTSEGSEKTNGLRYRVHMDKTAYENLSSSGFTDIKFGVLIAPANGYNLTQENVFGEEVIYDWAIKQEDGSYVYSGTKKRIMNFYTQELLESGKNDEEVEFYGAIVNIKDGTAEDDATNNLARDFRGVGYVEYKDGEEVKYIMLTNENTVRSIAYVSQLAIADESENAPDETTKNWLADSYISKAPAVKYTVEHYKQNADGTYPDDATETATPTAAVSATVNAATTSAKEYDGYSVNEVRTQDNSGFVWANGSTVLKVFYEKNDLAATYGDLSVSFVQNNFEFDKMENTIVGGKLVTKTLFQGEDKGAIGNESNARPQLVIKGLIADAMYTVNITYDINFDNGGILVPFKTQGAGGNNYYSIANADGEKVWTVENVLADENGVATIGSWYGSAGTYTWQNVTVTRDDVVATYGVYSARVINNGSSAIIKSSVNDDGKLVTTFSGEVARTASTLVVSGMTPNSMYFVTLGVTAEKDIYCYSSTSGSWKNWLIIRVETASSKSATQRIVSDANGEWRYNGFYNSAANTVTWDVAVSVQDTASPIANYGDYTLNVYAGVNNNDDAACTITKNDGGQIVLNTNGKSFGNVAAEPDCSGIVIGGLVAGQTYNINLSFTVSGIADTDEGAAGTAIAVFFKNRANSGLGKVSFVSGTNAAGTSLAGKAVNGIYPNGDYVVSLSGTANEAGYIRFNGLYTAFPTMTFTGIAIV